MENEGKCYFKLFNYTNFTFSFFLLAKIETFYNFVDDDDDDDRLLQPSIIQQEKQTSSFDEIVDERQAISLTKIQSSVATSTLCFNPIDDKVFDQHRGFIFQIDFESLLHKNSKSEYDGNPSPVSNAIEKNFSNDCRKYRFDIITNQTCRTFESK